MEQYSLCEGKRIYHQHFVKKSSGVCRGNNSILGQGRGRGGTQGLIQIRVARSELAQAKRDTAEEKEERCSVKDPPAGIKATESFRQLSGGLREIYYGLCWVKHP